MINSITCGLLIIYYVDFPLIHCLLIIYYLDLPLIQLSVDHLLNLQRHSHRRLCMREKIMGMGSKGLPTPGIIEHGTKIIKEVRVSILSLSLSLSLSFWESMMFRCSDARTYPRLAHARHPHYHPQHTHTNTHTHTHTHTHTQTYKHTHSHIRRVITRTLVLSVHMNPCVCIL